MDFSFNKLKQKNYYKYYLLGVVLLIIYALCHKLIYSQVILIAGVFIIEVGFIIWVINFYKDKIKGKPFYIFAFSIVNLFILWFSNIYAQDLIVQSFGLPAEDFSLTLHLLVLLCYIPAAIIFTILIFIIIYLGIFVYLMLMMFKNYLYVFIHPFLVMLGKADVNYKMNLDHRVFLHFLAFAINSLLLVGIFQFIVNHNSSFYPSIRYIAYNIDYQYLYNYPKIDKDKKTRLHANNYFSIMEGSGQNLKVVVKKIED
ncbi:hypothetical protein [Acinetobacter nosocomialis]|uniref:Uncharacterized protein n=1 Tax=Acinetobacter nosocomialis TaxID=106654 RepID=A0A2L1VHI0_ACINO|nr:hypothetical protein [Acinetobacter nosocomialis]AVF44700.1 hypothetical protein AL533_10015 [Acinetobacter nosocomialis]MBP1500140.1 hypothetical protein [Acinetobacter nosocomialis]MDE1706818.1 hypothetical protein [Acinetobacter nosocomialis]HDG9766711.1 hypothetical protein [Acinetobacter nosocomialis]